MIRLYLRSLCAFVVILLCALVSAAKADCVVVFNEIMYHPATNELPAQRPVPAGAQKPISYVQPSTFDILAGASPASAMDGWLGNGQKRVNGSSCVNRSPERFRKGAGGQG